jgi:hypothetical protein
LAQNKRITFLLGRTPGAIAFIWSNGAFIATVTRENARRKSEADEDSQDNQSAYPSER